MIFKKKETPNCAICRWRSKERYSLGYECEAQAGAIAFIAYDNKKCKKLYEEFEICLSGKFEIEKVDTEKIT